MFKTPALAALVFATLFTLPTAGNAHEQFGQPGSGMMPMMGPGMGPGMMGPGMMGPCGQMMGGQGMGPGMMGQGMGPGMMGQGMGPGMMGQGMGPGPMGQGMGPGMMGQDMGPGMMGQGMGPGMMGQGMQGAMRQPLPTDLSADQVSHMLEHHLAWQGNPNLKLGTVEETDGDTITAEIVTQDGALVQRLAVDRHTGTMQQIQ